MNTIDKLREQSNEIRNEKTRGANTATRMGGMFSALIDQIEATDIGEIINHNRYDEITQSGVYRVCYVNGPTGNKRSNNEILIVATTAGASSGIRQTLYRSFGVQTREKSAASWSEWRDVIEILQGTGSSTDAVMSQNAVTMALNNLKIKTGVAEEIDAKIDDGVYVLYPRNPYPHSPVSSNIVLVSNAYIGGASITTKQYSDGRMREKSGSAPWGDWFLPLMPIGRGARNIGAPKGIAIGDDSSAVSYSVAVGDKADAKDKCVSIGVNAYSEAESMALGANANAGGNTSIAIGGDSESSLYGIAIGDNSAAKESAIAIGMFASALTEATALGHSSASRDGSVAIGYAAKVTEPAQESIQIGSGNNMVTGSYQEFNRYLRMVLRGGSEVRFPAIPPYCLHIKGILEGDKVVDTILNHSSVRSLHQSPNQTAEELDFEWSQGFEMISFPAQIQNILIEKF